MCVFLCVYVVSGGGGDICVVSVSLETVGGHKGVCWSVTVPCRHPSLTLCVVCQRLEGCHAVGMVCVSGDVMSRNACWASGLGSGGCFDGCVVSLRWACCGGLPHTWLLEDLGVMVLMCSGDMLCVTRCMCVVGVCDPCGVRFMNLIPSSQCL